MVHVQEADLVLIFFKIKVFMLSALDPNASFLDSSIRTSAKRG